MSVMNYPPLRCKTCKGRIVQPFPFSMAFQPVVDVAAGSVYAYEALVRGMEENPPPACYLK
jgi:EAL domain-containing protein (putative c-di-GMP-specific phosphodiesterase class I)